ncbi:biosynthetic peptidoglycan transglycosylase, partial [Salmonella enterica]|uniref:biosynthetic peptidoglycan transglycosylase n=1 Tax=Salmonella enterica TaxID=28901 RepID=UPI003CE9F801
TSGNFSQGGSTITRQLIKNTIFPNFSTETGFQKVERKVQEIYLAIQVERTIGKDKILENYLNAINLGQNTLGVQAAAQRYFG